MVKPDEKSPNCPAQVKKIIEEIKLKTDSDPLDERLVLVAKSNSHRGSSEEYFQSYLSSVLIQPADNIDTLLKQEGGITHNFSQLGQPIFYNKKYDETNLYEVSEILEENGTTFEAFAIEKEDPTLYTIFEPRQDFTLFYFLFDKIQGHNKVWNDHMRGINQVITFEREENKSELKISKNYVLDYLFLRKKALLLYSYLTYVVKAEDSVPDKYRQELSIVERKKRATITAVRDNRYGEQLVVRAEIIKSIMPPTSRTLGDFGVLPQSPAVDFMTNNGKISMQTYSSHNLSDFLSIVFFKSEVLKRYEGDSRYRIDDDGGVHYRGVWGIFRGIWRLGDEIIAAHLGDIVENLPFEELPHWAANNINPISTSEVAEYRQIRPIPKLINDLISQLESFNYRNNIFLKKNGIVDGEPIIKNFNQNMEAQIFPLKKTFTCNTTKDEFLQRTLILYKIIIDNLNLRLLKKIVDFYNPQYKVDEHGNPLGSLKLFLVCIKLMIIDKAVSQSGIAGDFHSSVNKYFDSLQQAMVDPSGDFLLAQIKEKFEELEQTFGVLFTIYAFRSKSGAAHPGSETEFIRALESLGFEENQTDFLPVYRKLIKKLCNFFLET